MVRPRRAQDFTECERGAHEMPGIAIGMMFTISPLWIGETCRPELRGFFLCFFNTSIVFGQFAMWASYLYPVQRLPC